MSSSLEARTNINTRRTCSSQHARRSQCGKCLPQKAGPRVGVTLRIWHRWAGEVRSVAVPLADRPDNYRHPIGETPRHKTTGSPGTWASQLALFTAAHPAILCRPVRVRGIVTSQPRRPSLGERAAAPERPQRACRRCSRPLTNAGIVPGSRVGRLSASQDRTARPARAAAGQDGPQRHGPESGDTTQRHDTETRHRDTTQRHDTETRHRDTTQGHDTGTRHRDTIQGDTTRRHDTETQHGDTTQRHDTGTRHRDTTQGHDTETRHRDTTQEHDTGT